MRSNATRITIAIVFLACGGAAFSSEANGSRVNVLFIAADDLRKD